MTLSEEAAREYDDRAADRVPGDPYASDPDRPVTSARRPWWRWLFLLPGLAAVVYGAQGLLGAGGRVPLSSWFTWFLGSALLHDLVIAPVWIGLGWLAARFLHRPARPPVVVAAAVTGMLTLVVLPFVLGYGADPNNPSFLPREYGRNLLLIAAAIWLVAAVWALVAVRRARRTA
ncbi:hypothetical protein SAMN05661080_01223 [Modestobacter sp. DSM 44400]|uniref:hypothetical protein n=1 Tax=Modestobacter sp. DSM 44400 TaxID=1550230 RepID=UPI0008946FA8|nr:hypothetical protein [Modestobacter sp. DSM 44400]SDX79312.1 hypothetical protein SAMN05661080_01223 [Modestobacter sp. DSM 44400]